DLAQQLLVRRGDRAARESLQMLALKSQLPQVRVQAMCVLDGLGVLNAEVIAAAMNDGHGGVRRHAIRLAESFAGDSVASRMLLRRFEKMAGDSDPLVRLQLTYTLGEFHTEHAARSLAKLAHENAADPHVLAAALSSVKAHNVDIFVTETLRAARDGRPSERLLEQALRMPIAARDVAQWTRTFDALDDDDGSQPKGVRWRLSAVACWLELGQRRFPNLMAMLDSGRQNQIKSWLQIARDVLRDPAKPVGHRVAATRLLARDKSAVADDIALLGSILTPRETTELQQAAIARLSELPRDDVPPALLSNWPAHSPVIRGSILDALLNRPAWHAALVRAMEQEHIVAADIDATRRQRLLTSGDEAIRVLAEKLFAAHSGSRQQVVDAYTSALANTGDAARGQVAFSKSCATCHRVGDVGKAVGPDLIPLASKPPQALVLAILDPNQAVDPRYLTYAAQTDDGRTVMGLLASESAAGLTLIAPDGKEETLLRGEIKQFRSTGKSLMPDGIEKDISPPQMADLLAYLAAIGQPTDARAAAEKQAIDRVRDTKAPPDDRHRLISEHPHLAAKFIAALAADIPANAPKEEYARIPWIWQVAIAAGKRNDAAQIKQILTISLPPPTEPLRDWQAVVLGGGIVNGISQTGPWPRERVAEILKGDADLSARWDRAIELASAMSDDAKAPHGTRYDALRMIGVDTWARRGAQLVKYLAPGGNDELQMGAVSALSDMPVPEASAALLDNLDNYSANNRRLALDAMFRSQDRVAALLDRIESKKIPRTTLSDRRVQLLKNNQQESIRKRAAALYP
ncbi:MAG: c-type cytochrome, partial [Pirellulales bacterium]